LLIYYFTMMFRGDNKRGQVWIETVIYILIGMAIISILLAFIKPKIDGAMDKATIERGIEILTKIDSTINEIKFVSGNSRPMEIGLKRGEILVNSLNDTLIYLLEDSKYEYSESGQRIEVAGRYITVNSTTTAGKTDVKLILSYEGAFNISSEGRDLNLTIKKSPVVQTISIKNLIVEDSDYTVIDFELV